jgi:hypothetical protein
LAYATTTTASSAVGTYAGAVTPSGLSSSNYAITFAAGNMVVAAAPLTVVGNGTQVYGGSNQAFSASYSGFVLSQGPSVLSGTLAYATTTAASSAVGTYPGAVTPSGLSSGNYAITFAAGNMVVTPAPLTITGSGTQVYGGSNQALSAIYSGFVLGQNSSVLSGTLALTTTATASSPAGTYAGAVTPSGLIASSYAITFAAGNMVVTPAPLTIMGTGTQVYGGSNQAFSASYSGFVLSQGPSVLSGTLAFTTTTTNSSPAGTYPSAVTPIGLTASNYAITFAGGNMVVTPAPLAVTGSGTQVYGGSNQVFSASYSGFVLSQTSSVLSGTLAFTTTTTNNSAVGTYAGAVTPSGVSSGNYAITFAAGSMIVTAAPLTITGSGTQVCGGSNQTLSAIYSGFVLGQNSSVLSGTLALTTTATASSPAGTYPGAVTPSGLTASNYAITFAAGNMVVTPAPLAITGSGTQVYGGSNQSFSASYSGFVLNQTAGVLSGTLAFTTTTTSSSPVGTYAGAVSPGGVSSSNYAITFAAGTMVVTAAPLTITGSGTQVYGHSNQTFSAAYSGLVLGQGPSVLSGTLAFSTMINVRSAAGTYNGAVTPSGLSSSNYTITFIAGSMIVVPAPLTITADNETKTYGQTFTFNGKEFTTSNLYNSDSVRSVTLTSPGAPASATVAGSPYPITPSAAVGKGLSNYAITYVDGSLTVIAAAVTITANSTTMLAGQRVPALTASFSGLGSGGTTPSLSLQPTLSTTASSASPAGVYPIVVSGASSPDYSITYVNGTLTVIAPPATVESVSIQTRKIGKKNTQVIVLQFNEALNAIDAESIATYSLETVAKTRKQKPKPVGLAQAIYSASARSFTVTLITRKRLTLSQPLELTIYAEALLDALGRPLDGNDSGQPGTNFVATLTRAGTTINSLAPESAAARLSAPAVDVLLGGGFRARSRQL